MRQHDLAMAVLVSIVRFMNHIIVQIRRLEMRQKLTPLSSYIFQSYDRSTWLNFQLYGGTKGVEHQPNLIRATGTKQYVLYL